MSHFCPLGTSKVIAWSISRVLFFLAPLQLGLDFLIYGNRKHECKWIIFQSCSICDFLIPHSTHYTPVLHGRRQRNGQGQSLTGEAIRLLRSHILKTPPFFSYGGKRWRLRWRVRSWTLWPLQHLLKLQIWQFESLTKRKLWDLNRVLHVTPWVNVSKVNTQRSLDSQGNHWSRALLDSSNMLCSLHTYSIRGLFLLMRLVMWLASATTLWLASICCSSFHSQLQTF